MKAFFDKHGGSSDPTDAIEILVRQIMRVREMVYAGDKNHLQELKELSEMIDDYVAQAQGQKFEPKPYRSYEGGQGHNLNQPKSYDRDRDYDDFPQSPNRGGIGYMPYYPPFFPYGRDDGYNPRRR